LTAYNFIPEVAIKDGSLRIFLTTDHWSLTTGRREAAYIEILYLFSGENMLLFILMFIPTFVLINFYVFIRGWQVVPSGLGFRPVYAVLYWLVALSFIGGRFPENILPSKVADVLTWTGSFWIAALLYLFLALFILDALRVVNHFLPFFPGAVVENYARAKYAAAGIVLGAVALILLCGFINARVLRVTELELSINKPAGELKSLNVVVVSDTHLGTIVGRSRLAPIVDQINALSPDIVLLPGDVMDGETGPAIRRNLGEELKRIQARYGVFAVMGNHEYIGGGDATSRYLAENNITVLRDQSVKIGDSFSIIGREDRSINRFAGRTRKDLETLADEVDRRLPVILLDHQPFDLHEAADNGIDLQLSGHTHHGQLWPLNYIVNAIYELAWGYKRVGDTHYYVSNGASTWGPPVRMGSRPEIVRLRLNFQQGNIQ
jgi:predicted MPP superfamily phosphohydrolase